jgi:hypothetical protein
MSHVASVSTRPSVKANVSTVDAYTLAAFCAIAIPSLALRIALSPQVSGLDDTGYLQAAQVVSQGHSLDTLFGLFRLRVGMAYPLGLAMRRGWLQPDQFWLLTVAAEAITLTALFAAARNLVSIRAGLVATLLYGVYPIAVQQTTLYMPTAFQVAAISVAVALLSLAVQSRSTTTDAAMAAGGGVALGLGYLVKEDVALIVPVLALAALLSRFARLRHVVWMCLGAATVFFSECLVYWYTTGNPLFRLTVTSGLGAPPADLAITDIWAWNAYIRTLFVLPAQVGLFWWAAIPALWFSLRSSDRSVRFAGAALVLAFCYLQFGSGSFTEFSPLPKTPRYTAIATPFLILTLAVWLAHWSDRSPRPAGAVLTVLTLVSVPCIFLLHISASERMRNTVAVLPVLRDHAPARIYTDYYSARLLTLLLPPRVTVVPWYHADFKGGRMLMRATPQGDSGAYVLFDRQASKIYTSSYEMTLPDEVTQVRREWIPVWSGRAYAEGSFPRSVLSIVGSAAERWPRLPMSSRVAKNIRDMIDADDATLYRIP